MKKTLFFILVILVLMVSSCNLFLKEEYGELILSFDGSLPDGARALDSKGLPVLSSSPMKIDIIRENGYTITRELGAEEPKSLVELVPVGEKIGIKVILISDLAEWAGYAEHIVTAGPNKVDVKLSKTLKVAANLLFSITGKDSSGSNIVSLSTQNGKKLLDGILIGKKPVTARDKVGRIYVLYEDASSTHHLKRFDVEGKEDTGFEAALAAALPLGVTIGDIDNIAIDIDDNYIFLFKQNTVYCFKEKEDHSFESFSSASFPSAPPPVPSSSAVAVYDDVLFAVYDQTLFACKFEFEDASGHSGAKRLKFESQATRKPLDKLRSDPAFGNNRTECTGLVVDENHVYCLLKEQGLHHGKLYALGQLVCYKYSGSTFTEKTKIGLNPAASTADPIAFNAQYFSNPIGFIGYDEENIYIADDGVNIGYINENWRIKGNKNRIAAFNRETDSLSFSDSGATWYEEKPEYKLPNTKILLWEKQSPAMALSPMNYWTSANGTETYSEENKLFEYSYIPFKKPTDVFCYDQDGNLYVMYEDAAANKYVRRFALKEDGSYAKPGLDLSSTLTSAPISAIAVDISDGQNSLYYVYTAEDSGNTHAFLQRLKWNLGDTFDHASPDPSYLRRFNPNTSVTALAANKDGVFVGIKETYQEGGIDKYRLKVQKYAKISNPAHLDGELTLVDNAPVYTDASGMPIDYGHFSDNIRIQYGEAINDLKVFDGLLYALSSKSHEIQKNDEGPYFTDAFKNSGILYKIGSTNSSLPGNAVVLAKKDWNDTTKIGYGFYRFIAVKYDEAERIKLIIASDGAWGKGGLPLGSSPDVLKNTDKVLEYDLKGSLQTERNSGGSFSKTLKSGSGFEWY
ncbi:hypothetical protein [Treponema denticola]|uniref:hypothetical protein n=1 Tax=Treponema denticola TaxID=158 RepID=UPI0002B5E9F0|nr:hypothetical protein [Treponema denticola]EMB41848.1 hypothetical protein HMPREF9722_01202 [Treponema denticola ATCC 33520]UTC84739.1 hypothetical protein E4N91_03405 [Treponema denticola]